MLNYDRIKAMTVDELAEFIYSANDKICFEIANWTPAINTSASSAMI